MVSQERLKELLAYNPDSGLWFWKVDRGSNKTAGKMAGTRVDGYVTIKIDRKIYKAHRLAFLYMNGCWPKNQVDHIDLDKANNQWSNLREATSSENRCNIRTRKDNTSGNKGVYWHKRDNKWYAYITKSGKATFLGSYSNKKDAADAYTKASVDHHGDFGRIV